MPEEEQEKKTASKKAAKKSEKPAEPKAEETTQPEEAGDLEEEQGAQTLAEESGSETLEAEPEAGAPDEEELSDEELRQMVEESLERVTMADIVLNMMNQLASIGYLKMGLPENVTQKYQHFDKAKLAIDILDAMLKASEGRIPEQASNAFRGTLANMQLNFVQLKAHS